MVIPEPLDFEPKLVYYPVKRPIRRIVIHHSATFAHMDIGAAEIEQWHLERGFNSIGYHFVIRRNGLVETGRAIAAVGEHVRGHNADSIGICLVGGLGANRQAENTFTKAQMFELAVLVRDLLKTWPNAEICGHKDLAATECPAFDVVDWWAVEGEQHYVQY